MKSFKKSLAKWTGIGEGFSFSSKTLLEMTNSGCLKITVDLVIPVNIKENKHDYGRSIKLRHASNILYRRKIFKFWIH